MEEVRYMTREADHMTKSELLELGMQYKHIRNYEKAKDYFKEAVLQGSSRGAKELFELGRHFYKVKEYAQAFDCFEILSGMGHGPSTLYLGRMYEYGYGKRANVQEAFDHYAASYQQGLAEGAYYAGRLMMGDALHSEEVRDIAISWFKEAIAGGIYKSYAEIGKLYLDRGAKEQPGYPVKNNRTALSWFLRGAVHGDNLCREIAADCFIHGIGTEVNVKRGLELYGQAFHDDSVSACRSLGNLYANGDGVHKNIDLAIAWYLKGYERGDKRGRYEAGRVSYRAGQLYPGAGKEEKERALKYLNQAASLGYADAYDDLAGISREEGNEKKFVTLLKQGMKAGSDLCRKNLIDFYCRKAAALLKETREEVAPDKLNTNKDKLGQIFDDSQSKVKMAAEYYKKAARAGDEDSWAVLARMYLYIGDALEVKDRDFIKAAKNGYTSGLLNTRVLLWRYYAGPGPTDGEIMHQENPKQAFLLARQLAAEGYIDFYKVLSDYYRDGYGTKKSARLAKIWANKVRV